MDKRKFNNNDNVHDMLAEAMQEACTKDDAYDYKSPDIDLSFLAEDTKKKKCFSRFGKIAAIVAIILLGMNVVILSGNFSESYGDKGILHRIHEGVRGIFTDEDPSKFKTTNDVENVYIINDYEEISSAYNIWEDVLILDNKLGNYQFINLQINCTSEGKYTAEYKYLNDGEELSIGIMELCNLENIATNLTDEVISNKDKIINLYCDEVYGKYSCDICINELIVYIYGDLHKEEILEIVNIVCD